MFQPDYGLGVRVAWGVLWPILRGLGAVGFRYEIERRAPIPKGPFVVASNHTSHLDPPVVGVALGKPVRFLTLDELWGTNPILDSAFRVTKAVPLSRTRYPLSAMRTALVHLEAGGRIGVFPEGRRARAWGESLPKRGAAWLALRAGVPMLPVAISGANEAMPMDGGLAIHRAKIRVVVGRAIDSVRHCEADDPVGSLTEAWHQQMTEELEFLAAKAAR